MSPLMRDSVLRPILLVVLLGLLVACIKVMVGWWNGEVALADDVNWLWLVLFPILLWIWFRYFSVFGCKQPACLLPKDEAR
jgi:hypothetical protein